MLRQILKAVVDHCVFNAFNGEFVLGLLNIEKASARDGW